MAEVTIKALVATEQAFKDAAIAYSEATRKVSKSRPLSVAMQSEAFEALQVATLGYVRVLLLGQDGKGLPKIDRKSDLVGEWIQALRSIASDKHPSVAEEIANVCKFLEKKPYAVVFRLAEMRAAQKGRK